MFGNIKAGGGKNVDQSEATSNAAHLAIGSRSVEETDESRHVEAVHGGNVFNGDLNAGEGSITVIGGNQYNVDGDATITNHGR